MSNVRTIPVATATQNACKVCAPLGACLAFRGVEGAIPLLHGSQGCATYIRRHVIGHFREPMDIASSSFTEQSAIFGGKENLEKGLKNVIRQYRPRLVGVASTCLSETIGDDVNLLIRQFREGYEGDGCPAIVPVSTPSYRGTQTRGFQMAVRAIVDHLVVGEDTGQRSGVNVLPGILSPADIRYLKELLEDFGVEHTILPDYSDTLDGPAAVYEALPSGGTSLDRIVRMGQAETTLVFSPMLKSQQSGGALLSERFGVPQRQLCMPVGLIQTDALFQALEDITGKSIPPWHALERGRLIDSYVDAHKYVFGKRVIVYGEEDLVIGLASFLVEIGAVPAVCASSDHSGRLREALETYAPSISSETIVLEDADFAAIAAAAELVQPDLFLGNSNGYSLSRQMEVPLIRVGFPIQDRIGGQRVLHVGYRGAQQLFDQVVNELLRKMQSDSPTGYTHY